VGSKNAPGRFDCYWAAAPDEEMFTLLARDDLAPGLTNIWALLRLGAYTQARTEFEALLHTANRRIPKASDGPKAEEAGICAAKMIEWKKAHP
jgi:hypothetical protein